MKNFPPAPPPPFFPPCILDGRLLNRKTGERAESSSSFFLTASAAPISTFAQEKFPRCESSQIVCCKPYFICIRSLRFARRRENQPAERKRDRRFRIFVRLICRLMDCFPSFPVFLDGRSSNSSEFLVSIAATAAGRRRRRRRCRRLGPSLFYSSL